MGQLAGCMYGEELVKKLQPLVSHLCKELKKFCYGVGGYFANWEVVGKAPGDGLIESERLSQYTAARREPICNVASGSRI